MVLIRIIILHCLIHNVKLSAKHVIGKSNTFADLLSRLKYKKFWQTARKNGKNFNNKPETLPEVIWPMQKIWTKVPKLKGKRKI